MKFVTPENIAECERRLAVLIGEESKLLADLRDPTALEMPANRYPQWKSALTHRHAQVIQERKLLEAWKSNYYREEKERNSARKEREKQERRNQILSHLDRMKDVTTEEETALIRQLFGKLTHFHRATGVAPDSETQVLLDRVTAYLIGKGEFDP